MFIEMDIRTLFIVNAIATLLISTLLFFVWKGQKYASSLIYIACAYAALAVGGILFAFRNSIPDFFSIIVSNTLYVVWILLVWKGIRAFRDIAYPNFLAMALLIIFFVIFTYFTIIQPSTGTRIVIISLSLASISIISVKDLLLSTTEKKISAEHRYTASVLIVFTLFLIIRVLATMFDNISDDFMSANMLQQWAVLILNLTSICFSLGFLWILQRDVENRLYENTLVLRKSNSKNKRLKTEAFLAAMYDPLTGAGNRRKFEDDTAQKFSPHLNTDECISLAFLDIDHFKKLNDTYGHESGDEVLRSLTALIISHIRKLDTVYRFGGEEFVILMPDTTIQIATEISERLRKQIENTIKIDGASVTVSIGVTESAEQDTLEDIIERADKLMYKAKQTSRNLVVSDS